MIARRILVAAAAAIIASGSSVAALAGSWSFSKGESSSFVVSTAHVSLFGGPTTFTIQGSHEQSVAVGSGGGAATTSSTGSLSIAGQAAIGGHGFGGAGQVAVSGGYTSGSSCAGSGCK